jgi:lipocalin-like protein
MTRLRSGTQRWGFERAAVAVTLLPALALGISTAAAEPANPTHAHMVGTWTLVSLTGGDGANLSEPFGRNPKGVMTVDADGHFSIIIRRSDLPRIASNNRLTATAEEGQAIVKASIAYFGTLSFGQGAEVTAHIAASTFANADGENQRRVVTFDGDRMEYANFSSSFGAAVAKAVWTRAK